MDALSLVALAKALFALGVDIEPTIAKLFASFKPGAPVPTEAEWAAMQADEVARITGILQPFPEDGE